MDIFKALTHGDGTINEPNTTSFLFYLLANYRDTIGGGLFTWLLSKCDIDDCDEVDYDVEIEYRVENRDIDLLITFRNNNINYALLLENKLNVSDDIGQLNEQYNFYVSQNRNQMIYSILLCPEHDSFDNLLIQNNNNSRRVNWGTSYEDEHSLIGVLHQNMGNVDVEQMDCNLLKSFINFIIKKTSQFRASTYGVDEIDSDFIVYRNLDKKVYVVDEQGEDFIVPRKMTVLAKLRYINEEFELKLKFDNQSGQPKNTRTLGAEVITALNHKYNNTYYEIV
jgi:hypothetical protein